MTISSLSCPDVLETAVEINPSRDELRLAELNELIFRENSGRWVLLPVEYPTLFEFYKRSQSNFWTPESLPWQGDAAYFGKSAGSGGEGVGDHELLSRLIHRLAVHSCLMAGIPSDKKSFQKRSSMKVDPLLYRDVLDLTCEFTEHVQSPEARAFLGFQNLFENFHREAASKIIDMLEPIVKQNGNGGETACFESEQGMQELRLKMQYLHRHLEGFIDETKIKKLAGDSEDFRALEGKHSLNASPIVEVITALVCLKGIFMLAPLALIRYLCISSSGKELAVSKACELMLRDLFLQADFLTHIYANIENRLSHRSYVEIIRNAIEFESMYLSRVLEDSHMSTAKSVSDLMGRYLRNLGSRFVRASYPEMEEENRRGDETGAVGDAQTTFFGLPCTVPLGNTTGSKYAGKYAAKPGSVNPLDLPETIRFQDPRFHIAAPITASQTATPAVDSGTVISAAANAGAVISATANEGTVAGTMGDGCTIDGGAVMGEGTGGTKSDADLSRKAETTGAQTSEAQTSEVEASNMIFEEDF